MAAGNKKFKKRKTQQIKQPSERLSEHCEAVLGGWAERKSLKGVGSGARPEDFQLSAN